MHQFNELYQRYGHLVYVRCRRLLGEEQAAEDATQEVFCRVATHLERVPDAEEARLWIYRISSNDCLNEIRRKRRHPQSVECYDGLTNGDAEGAIVVRDLARRILARTPKRCAAATWLHCVDGLSHDEVGRKLGISRRTVINYIENFANSARKFADRQA